MPMAEWTSRPALVGSLHLRSRSLPALVPRRRPNTPSLAPLASAGLAGTAHGSTTASAYPHGPLSSTNHASLRERAGMSAHGTAKADNASHTKGLESKEGGASESKVDDKKHGRFHRRTRSDAHLSIAMSIEEAEEPGPSADTASSSSSAVAEVAYGDESLLDLTSFDLHVRRVSGNRGAQHSNILAKKNDLVVPAIVTSLCSSRSGSEGADSGCAEDTDMSASASPCSPTPLTRAVDGAALTVECEEVVPESGHVSETSSIREEISPAVSPSLERRPCSLRGAHAQGALLVKSGSLLLSPASTSACSFASSNVSSCLSTPKTGRKSVTFNSRVEVNEEIHNGLRLRRISRLSLDDSMFDSAVGFDAATEAGAEPYLPAPTNSNTHCLSAAAATTFSSSSSISSSSSSSTTTTTITLLSHDGTRSNNMSAGSLSALSPPRVPRRSTLPSLGVPSPSLPSLSRPTSGHGLGDTASTTLLLAPADEPNTMNGAASSATPTTTTSSSTTTTSSSSSSSSLKDDGASFQCTRTPAEWLLGRQHAASQSLARLVQRASQTHIASAGTIKEKVAGTTETNGRPRVSITTTEDVEEPLASMRATYPKARPISRSSSLGSVDTRKMSLAGISPQRPRTPGSGDVEKSASLPPSPLLPRGCQVHALDDTRLDASTSEQARASITVPAVLSEPVFSGDERVAGEDLVADPASSVLRREPRSRPRLVRRTSSDPKYPLHY